MAARRNYQILSMSSNDRNRFLANVTAVPRAIAKGFEIEIQKGGKEQHGSD